VRPPPKRKSCLRHWSELCD